MKIVMESAVAFWIIAATQSSWFIFKEIIVFLIFIAKHFQMGNYFDELRETLVSHAHGYRNILSKSNYFITFMVSISALKLCAFTEVLASFTHFVKTLNFVWSQ